MADQPDAVTEGNALCQAIRERDALRKQVENWSDELADALGCVNEPCFSDMVEMVRRLRDERDELSLQLLDERKRSAIHRDTRDHADRVILDAHRKLDEAGAGTRALTVVGRIGELDQVAMAALHGLLAAVQFNPDQGSPYAPITAVSDALAIADAFLKERSR